MIKSIQDQYLDKREDRHLKNSSLKEDSGNMDIEPMVDDGIDEM